MIKKNNYFTCFIWSGAGAGRSQVFLAPWSRSRSRLKKNQEPEPLWKKNEGPETEPLVKKVGSRSRKKICRLPSPWKKGSKNLCS